MLDKRRARLRADERAARARVCASACPALTMAEYFRDQGQDVLLFIDNIFRFAQAGSEVSALLGRMPSAVGYQPTLATEMGQLQERITSTQTGSVTSVQAIYVPADDLTDPAPANTFAHLDSSVVLTADTRRAGDLSGGRSARLVLARVAAGDHLRRSTTARRHGCRRSCSATATCRTSSPSSASTSSPTRTSSSCTRARKIQRFLSQPNFVAEQFTGTPGEYVKLEDTIKGFREILDGKHDELPGAGLLHGRDDRAAPCRRVAACPATRALPSKRRTKRGPRTPPPTSAQAEPEPAGRASG